MTRLIAILAVCAQVALGGETSVAWQELGRSIAGKEISVSRSEGKRIKGTNASVEAEALAIDTSKGRQSIPRSSVREIRILRSGSYKWRLIGAAIGAGIGLGVAAPILAETHNEGSGRYDAAVAGLIGGLAALGFWAGASADRGDVIRVLPN